MATGPPLWQEPPVFNLPRVPGRIAPPLPKTYAVLIRGIDGQTSPQLVEAHRATFLDAALTITFTYKPCMIAGEQATDETSSQVASNLLDFVENKVETWEDDLSIMFFAYDLGGIVLKQAFTSISTRAQYRRILDRTSLVVFYGTPHQSSGSPTWAVSILRILYSCYRGLLGPWVPAYIEWISQYQQRLDQRFRALTSSFRVMNVCQKGLSLNYEFITDPLCAVLGVSGEETVLLERSHYQLGYILGHDQREFMEGRMRGAVICHWEYYRAFVGVLRLVSQQNFRSPIPPDRPLQELPLKLFLADPKAARWEKTSLPSTIRLILGDDMSAEDLYTVFAQHVAGGTDSKATIVLRLGPEHHYKELSTLGQVYAALCVQFLEQEPSLILWIRHLYANLRDAVLGVDKQWKLRVLTRCLKTLLLTPKRGVTYCLIHHTSDISRENAIAQILSTTRESEIPFRLLVSTPTMAEVPAILESWDCIDLSSTGGLLKGGTARMRESLPGTPNALVLNEPSNPAPEMKPDDNMMATLGRGRRLPLWRPRVRSPETVLSECVDDDMAWVLRATAWIVYAVRPLSRLEVEQISEIIYTKEASLPVGMKHGEALFQILEYSLSGFLHVSEGAVWVSPELDSGLRSVWAKRAFPLDPELYVARQCFSIAASLFPGNNSGAARCQASATPDTAVLGVLGQGGDNCSVTAVNTYEDLVRPLTSSYRPAVEEYVTRFWIQHQQSLASRMVEASDYFQGILDTRPLFDRNAWIQHLISSNWPKDIETSWGPKVQPEFMEQTYQLSPFDACYISFRLATLPLALEDDFEWLFLGIAREYLPEDAYIRLVMNVVSQLSDTSRDSMLQRVIGAATPDLRSKLLAEYDGDFFQKNFLEILLTAIAIGNGTAVTEMLVSNVMLGHKPKEKGDSKHRLGTALQIACEYGDIDTVKSLLSFKGNESPSELEVLYHWSALHVACHQGHRMIIKAFIDQLTKHIIQQLNRDQYCLLLVTSAHGLFAISKLLKELKIQVPASEESTSSPMQLAAKYGFPQTLYSLLSDHGCKMLLKNQKNNILSLAVESGNEEVMGKAKLAFVEAFMAASDQCIPVESFIDGSDSDNDDSTLSWDSIIKEAEGIQGNALLTAVECGRIRSIEFLLLSKDDSKVRDPKGRTPLMVASRLGYINLSQALFVKGDEQSTTMKTALHYACSYGHLEVVEFLIGTKKFSLTIRDEQSLTPMMAAAIGGHLQIVKILLSHLSSKDLKDEFLNAAMLGQETVMDMILKTAVKMDHKALDAYINPSGKGDSTPLYFAATKNHTRAVEFLLRRQPNLEKQNGASMLTPLASAAYCSAMESMKLLLDAGASTETSIGGKRKRLVLADSIFYEEVPVVKLLLEYGAEPRLPEYWGLSGSLLQFTMEYSTNAIFKVLLEHFEKVGNSVQSGSLPRGIPTATQALQTVIKHGTVEFLDTLLQVCKNFDQEIVENGFTFGSAFKYAAYHGSLEILEQLWKRFKKNIDINDTGGYYGPALHAAIIGSRDSLGKVRALLEWNAKATLPSSKADASTRNAHDISEAEDIGPFHGYWSTILHAAASAGDEKVVAAVLKLDGVSTDQPDRMGRLPLHIASLDKGWEFTQMLLSPESTFESTDSQGRNALHIACGGGNFDFVEKVVKDKVLASRMIGKTDNDGWTPLHWACRSGYLDLVKLLIGEGAKLDVKTRDGRQWLPYHVAIYHGWGPRAESTLKGESDGIDIEIKVEMDTRGICGCCGCAIYGVRHQCTSKLDICARFDLCFKCYEHCEIIHFPDHQFASLGEYLPSLLQ